VDPQSSIAGHIQGSVSIAPEEGNSEILSFSTSVHQTYDSGTGLPTGSSFHQPALLYKTYDQATVPLYEAQSRNESLGISVRMHRPNTQGATEHFYTVQLQGAHIVGIEDRLDPDTVVPYQVYFLTYDVVRWIDEDTGVQSSMTWGAGATNVDLAKTGTSLMPLPNPTAGATTLRFDLPESVPAELVVYDLRGRVVRRLYDGVTTIRGRGWRAVCIW
jgi:type VI secretion system Hcp family effector